MYTCIYIYMYVYQSMYTRIPNEMAQLKNQNAAKMAPRSEKGKGAN